MSQVADYNVPGSPLGMAALATALENIFAALGSFNRGPTAPSNPYEGMGWWDSSASPVETFKRYSVTAGWISLIQVNTTTGAFSFVGEAKATLTVAGDILYASAANTLARLAKGSARQVLGMNSGATAPQWIDSLQSLMTVAGDILYAAAANSPARLAKGTAYQHLGMNSGATAPEWQASLQAILTAAGDIIYASGANTPARLAKGTEGQVLRMNSGATAPEWATVFTTSLAGSGYIQLGGSGGFIIQWGSTGSIAAGNNYASVSFPIAFPAVLVGMYISLSSAPSPNDGVYCPYVSNGSTTGARIYNNANENSAITCVWMAIGY